jgi:hypothetical protein
MNWSVFGKILVKALPVAIELAQKMQAPGADKKAVAIGTALSELHELSPELASHPKVKEVVGKANDVLVEVQNVVAAAHAELSTTSQK